MKRLFVLVVLLIVHGSLYPWRFHAIPPDSNPFLILLHSWPGVHVNRFILRDTGVNLLLYLPLGLCGWPWLARSRRGPAAATIVLLIALLLSSAVETVQVYTPGRNSSLLDVLCNVTGAALGIAVAWIFSRRVAIGQGRNLPLAPLLLAGLWAGYLLYPLFPAFSRTWLGLKWDRLLEGGSWSWMALLASAAEWFVAGKLVEAAAGRGHAGRIFPFLLLLVPARLLLAGRTFTWPELAGAVAGWLLWANAGRSAYAAQAALFSTVLVLRGIYPFQFGEFPTAFQWVPFAPFLHTDWSFGFALLLRKAFDYGAAVWLFRMAGLDLAAAGAVVAAYLAAVEALQMFLPGRTPEITDPLLALLMAFMLSIAERYRPAGPPGGKLV